MRLFYVICILVFLIACQPKSQLVKNTNSPAEKKLSIADLENTDYDFSAHWVSSDLLLLPKTEASRNYQLLSFPLGGENSEARLNAIDLTVSEFPENIAKQFPHLADFQAYHVNIAVEKTRQRLKALPFVAISDEANALRKIAYVQTGFVLDDVYTKTDNDADEISDLGATVTPTAVAFKLWAPTAQSVKVLLFDELKSPLAAASIQMQEDAKSGVWSVLGDASLSSVYYQYELTLYHPETRKLETVITTDPYSLSLSMNSVYSQVVDLDAENTQPAGWAMQNIPVVDNPEDNIFYEVHIRDFSSIDPFLSDVSSRGKYKAFSETNSAGIQHLKSLRSAGLNNIHLLPTFDIGTIEENEALSIDINDPLSKICRIVPQLNVCQSTIGKETRIIDILQSYKPGSNNAQELVNSLKAFDNYNWGYDPYHYTVPEGSYANNPEGMARLIEFREMVQSLHALGFRVIMDVVYNHTNQAGLGKKSVLDKIVPNYYHRLNPITGAVERSTCCDNTATERVMMAKLMTDSLVVWARDYKIDGFRFDLMGHQPKEVMLAAREAVRAVDADTYFYGEGWNFGEVANNQRFVQASQLELGGSEIGTFSDRMRDAVRGCCFNSEADDIRKNQGIGNGLYTISNNLNSASQDQKKTYHLLLNHLRLGLVGNLYAYPLQNSAGEIVSGKDIPYGNDPAAYALDPADTINYVSKHDNQTLWDNNQYRNSYALTKKERVRMHNQNLSYVLLAQGIPFLHMGSEFMRSKSFLRDSYDYGDWFNRVDFTAQTNFYDVGLPPSEKDGANWPLIKKVLTNNEGRDHVDDVDIHFSSNVFKEFLAIRSSSPLFRMTTSDEIIQKVKFHNTGADQIPGLIVMSIEGNTAAESIVVVFNFSPTIQSFAIEGAKQYQLHGIQADGVDSIVKQSMTSVEGFTVPALTTAVFSK